MNASKPLKKCRENAQPVETIDLLLSEEMNAVCYLIAGCMAGGIKGA
jgi:hypothetical protein